MLPNQFQETAEAPVDEQQFLEDAKFAKIVTAVGGQGILIGGMVFSVMGPAPNSVELIAKALRGGDAWPNETRGGTAIGLRADGTVPKPKRA